MSMFMRLHRVCSAFECTTCVWSSRSLLFLLLYHYFLFLFVFNKCFPCDTPNNRTTQNYGPRHMWMWNGWVGGGGDGGPPASNVSHTGMGLKNTRAETKRTPAARTQKTRREPKTERIPMFSSCTYCNIFVFFNCLYDRELIGRFCYGC